jgi:hypothetical protein
MKFGKLFTQSVLALGTAAIFGSCNSTVNEAITPEQSPQVDGVHLTRAAMTPPTAFVKTSSTSDAVSTGLSDDLQKSGWVEHQFSDGRTLKFRNYMGSAMIEDDIIFAPTNMMPQAVSLIEKNLKKTKSTRGAGLNPNGCSLQIIWCWTPTSAFI